MPVDANKKSHRVRKSAGSHEVWEKQKKTHNAERPKQRFINGRWTRVPLVAPFDIVDEASGIVR